MQTLRVQDLDNDVPSQDRCQRGFWISMDFHKLVSILETEICLLLWSSGIFRAFCSRGGWSAITFWNMGLLNAAKHRQRTPPIPCNLLCTIVWVVVAHEGKNFECYMIQIGILVYRPPWSLRAATFPSACSSLVVWSIGLAGQSWSRWSLMLLLKSSISTSPWPYTLESLGANFCVAKSVCHGKAYI